jgi:hypothetical protein
MTLHPEQSIHEFKMFENGVLGGILEPKSIKVTKRQKNCIMRRFTICTFHSTSLG